MSENIKCYHIIGLYDNENGTRCTLIDLQDFSYSTFVNDDDFISFNFCPLCGQKVDIIYRLLEDQTIAIWPYEKATMDGSVESYMIVGQHGACSPEHIDNLPEPSEEQIAIMKAELQRIGYQV